MPPVSAECAELALRHEEGTPARPRLDIDPGGVLAERQHSVPPGPRTAGAFRNEIALSFGNIGRWKRGFSGDAQLDNGIETLKRFVVGNVLLRLGWQDIGQGEIVGLVRHDLRLRDWPELAPG